MDLNLFLYFKTSHGRCQLGRVEVSHVSAFALPCWRSAACARLPVLCPPIPDPFEVTAGSARRSWNPTNRSSVRKTMTSDFGEVRPCSGEAAEWQDWG